MLCILQSICDLCSFFFPSLSWIYFGIHDLAFSIIHHHLVGPCSWNLNNFGYTGNTGACFQGGMISSRNTTICLSQLTMLCLPLTKWHRNKDISIYGIDLSFPQYYCWTSQCLIPDSKVHGANMGPIWGRQDPGGPHVGPMNFAIWDVIEL